MNATQSGFANVGAYSRTMQAALAVSILVHILLGSIIWHLYQAPEAYQLTRLQLELRDLSVEELIDELESEPVTDVVDPVTEPSSSEAYVNTPRTPVEPDQPLLSTLNEVIDVISSETETAPLTLTPEIPVAVLVHPDSLEEFVRLDAEFSRVPSFKTFETLLRQESYFNSWTEKVTTFGKRVIPSNTTSKVFHGEVKLEVVLAMDGALENVELIDGAQTEYLNNLALSIVRMAAPFAPVPQRLLNRENRLVFQPRIVFRNKLAWVDEGLHIR